MLRTHQLYHSVAADCEVWHPKVRVAQRATGVSAQGSHYWWSCPQSMMIHHIVVVDVVVVFYSSSDPIV
jgi:hypothetical protein